MKSHEIADIFPLMNPKEFKELKEDIKQNGLMSPVIIYEGKILDGRNRYNACNELGVRIITDEYIGKDALQYVMSTNLKRRNLTDSQKAVVGIKYKKYYSIYAKQRMSLGGKGVEPVPQQEQARARDKAGEVMGVSGRYIDEAEELIKKNPEAEKQIMEEGAKVKVLLREIKLEEQKKEIEKVKEVTGAYDVIVIDPPWSYDDDDNYDPDNRRVSNPYPTMNTNEISNIKLPAKDNSVLWLWTTHKFIWKAKEIMEKWGYEYKICLVWNKESMGIGKWLRCQVEFCLLGIKGKPYFNNKNWRDIISEKRTTHSTKPEIFYKMVEEICAGRKLDYFARKERKGWDVYGDEV